MATVYFDVDYCLSVIKPNHRAFYQRVFRSLEIAPSRDTFEPLQQHHLELHGSRCARAAREPCSIAIPFFNSQPQ
jgi:hypothetical protein